MQHIQVSKEQAIAMLAVWQECGHNLPSLMKLSCGQTTNALHLLIPGYRCNQWYQFGEQYNSYSEAFSAYDELLDSLKLPAL